MKELLTWNDFNEYLANNENLETEWENAIDNNKISKFKSPLVIVNPDELKIDLSFSIPKVAEKIKDIVSINKKKHIKEITLKKNNNKSIF